MFKITYDGCTVCVSCGTWSLGWATETKTEGLKMLRTDLREAIAFRQKALAAVEAALKEETGG
jgi:hypothetical protein